MQRVSFSTNSLITPTTLTLKTYLTALISPSTLTQDNNVQKQKQYCQKLKSKEVAKKDPEKQLVKS